MRVIDVDELFLECDLLTGNINGMCVTDSLEELKRMEVAAKDRVQKIYDYNFKRLSRRGGKNEKIN